MTVLLVLKGLTRKNVNVWAIHLILNNRRRFCVRNHLLSQLRCVVNTLRKRSCGCWVFCLNNTNNMQVRCIRNEIIHVCLIVGLIRPNTKITVPYITLIGHNQLKRWGHQLLVGIPAIGLFNSAGFSTCNFINGRAQTSIVTQTKRVLQKVIHGAIWTQYQNSFIPSSWPSTSTNGIAIFVNRRIIRKLIKKRGTCKRSKWTI